MNEPLPGSFADVKASEGAAGLPGCPAERGAGDPSALPCLNGHNSITLLSSSHRRTAFALTENVKHLAARFGLERLGFLTLTFKDHVTDCKEAQRRFNSLRTNVLAERFEASITVMERMKSGRIHYHLLVVLAEDIRTGFDFAAVASQDYRSANAYLRREWSAWCGRKGIAARYGFGRTELLPVKSTAEGIAKYVGKYIAKHLGARRPDDKGARLVRYTVSARQVGTNFAWVSPAATKWRERVGELGAAVGVKEVDGIKHRLGPRWAHNLKEDLKEPDEFRWREGLHAIAADYGGEVARKPLLTVGGEVVAYLPSGDDLDADPDKICLTLDEARAFDVLHASHVPPVVDVEHVRRVERAYDLICAMGFGVD